MNQQALLFTAGSAHLLPKISMHFFEKIFHSGGTLTPALFKRKQGVNLRWHSVLAVVLVIVLY